MATLIAVSLSSSGCARRAYNDVYIENMAAEVRDLEDQLYEYDSEYRALEHEVQSLQAENARLQNMISSSSNGSGSNRNNRSTAPLSLPPMNSTEPRSFGSSGGTTSPSDFGARGGNKQESAKPSTPTAPSPTSPSTAPSVTLPASPLPASPSTTAPSLAPKLDITPGASQPSMPLPPAGNLPPAGGLPPAAIPPATLPAPKSVPGRKGDIYDDLQPPTIEPGEAMPPILPAPTLNSASPMTLDSNHDLELELGRIAIPGQLASTGSAGDRPSRVQPAASPVPSDTRIVEVKFHPSLCRAVNSDEQGDDDGLYLVLQPLNESGQFVPVAADLVIKAIDLSRDEKQATIGRWTFSTNDVKSKMQPIGSSQGIHLSLPFSGPAPGCDRVLVFVYYTLSDGRRVVAEQEVLLNNAHRQSTVWVPRAKGATPNTPTSPVRTASATR